MKSITNILLVAALVCYVFLPFYNIPLAPSSPTGFDFTAGMITGNFGWSGALFALVPFVASFAAIAFNCTKSRWWGIASCACIVVCMYFYFTASGTQDQELLHDPSIVPSNDIGEGFKIAGLGIGFKVSYALVMLSLLSSIVSILPFSFNAKLDRVIDDSVEHGIEEGRRHISGLNNKISEELSQLESKQRSRQHAKVGVAQSQLPAAEAPTEEQPAKPTAEKEDYSAYMPHDDDAPAYVAPKESTGDEKYAAYMPPQDGDSK